MVHEPWLMVIDIRPSIRSPLLSEPHVAELSRLRELDSISAGVRAYRRMLLQVEPSKLSVDKRTLAGQISQMHAALRDLQAALKDGVSMKGASIWGKYILAIDPDILAAITVCSAYDAVLDRAAVSPELHARQTHGVSSSIANAVRSQLELDRFRQDHPALFHRWSALGNSHWNDTTHQKFIKSGAMDQLQWDVSTRMHVGQALLYTLCKSTELFSIERRYETRRRRTCNILYVILDTDLLAEIEKQHDTRDFLQPSKPWMLVPPIPWECVSDDQLESGGYLLIKQSFIRRRNPDFEWQQEINHHDLSDTYDAINWIQSVPYEVNSDVLDIVSQIEKNGGGWGGIEQVEPLEPPPKPDYSTLTEEQIKFDKRLYYEHKKQENERAGRRLSNLRTIRMAKENVGRTIYTPWNCDWRGRMYPTVSMLSPQGDDLGGGLLRFRRPIEQTKEGRYWLSVHIANLCGQDKSSFDERVEWVHAHAVLIKAACRDPFDSRWWASQDDYPVRLLAAINDSNSVEGTTRIPVAQDATANGLQILSALCRDRRAAEAVNLLPLDRPNDVYQQVADRVCEIVRSDSENGRPDDDDTRREYRKRVAKDWLARGITRNTVKRAVMTTPYSVTDEGMARQFVQDKWCSYMNEAHYLGDRVREAMDDTFGAAMRTMDWLKEIARLMGHKGIAMRWVSPNQFLTVQEYIRRKRKTLFTALQKLTFYYPDRDSGIDTAKQSLGIVPNFVHSFDASHCMKIARSLRDQGVPAFLPVHDSFAVHAPYVPVLRSTTINLFADIFATDWLTLCHRMWQMEYGEELPPPPLENTLDIEEVREATYMIS